MDTQSALAYLGRLEAILHEAEKTALQGRSRIKHAMYWIRRCIREGYNVSEMLAFSRDPNLFPDMPELDDDLVLDYVELALS